MDRRVLVSAMAVFILTTGSSVARAQPAPKPLQKETTRSEKVVLGGQAEIWIDKDANPEAETLTIQKGTTDVVWYGRDGVKNLLIAFKPACPGQTSPPKRPPDPSCAQDECTLEKGKHKFRQGTFCYAIVVVRDDGTVKSLDPRIIINP